MAVIGDIGTASRFEVLVQVGINVDIDVLELVKRREMGLVDFLVLGIRGEGTTVLLCRVPGIVAVGGERSELAVIGDMGTAFRLGVLAQVGIPVDIDTVELVQD